MSDILRILTKKIWILDTLERVATKRGQAGCRQAGRRQAQAGLVLVPLIVVSMPKSVQDKRARGKKQQRDEDDFVDDRRKRQKRANDSSSSGTSLSVPPGHICLAESWRGGQVAKELAESQGWKVRFSDLRSCDFLTPSGHLVLFLSEAEYAGTEASAPASRPWKQRLARLVSGRRGAQQALVVCQRRPPGGEDFLAVQEFAVIDLGLFLVPVNDQVFATKPRCIAVAASFLSLMFPESAAPVLGPVVQGQGQDEPLQVWIAGSCGQL